MRTFSILLVMVLLIRCNSEKEETKSVENTKKEAETDSVHRINEDVAYLIAYELKDTVQRQDDKLFAYGTNVRLPKFVNKKKEAFNELNRQILLDFENDIRSFKHNAKPNPDEYRFIDFKTIIHDSILTVVVKDMRIIRLGEASSLFQVYHLDFKNNTVLDTRQLFAVLGLSQVPVLGAFAEQCTYPPEFTDALFDTLWFNKVNRKDLNFMKFYQNEKNQIVIIYPVAENGLEDELVVE